MIEDIEARLEDVCCQPLSDNTDLMLTEQGEIFLIVTDEDDQMNYFALGRGAKTLRLFKEAAEHLLTHIN